MRHELSTGVPVPLHWLSRKPSVTRSHSGISFLGARGKTHPSAGYLGDVEQQPLIYRAETCFVVAFALHHLWVGFCLSHIPMLVKHSVFWKEDLRNTTLISWGAQMWVKVGQILFWVTLVYSPSNLTGFGGITTPYVLRIKAKMSHFERITPTSIAIWFFLCNQWSDEGQLWKKSYTSQSIYKAKTLEKILVEHVETVLKTFSSFISSCPVVFLAQLQIHFITWCYLD